MRLLGREVSDSFLEYSGPLTAEDVLVTHDYGLTYDELCERILDMSNGAHNVEMPLGTAQWSTGQLGEHATRLLADAIRKRRQS